MPSSLCVRAPLAPEPIIIVSQGSHSVFDARDFLFLGQLKGSLGVFDARNFMFLGQYKGSLDVFDARDL